MAASTVDLCLALLFHKKFKPRQGLSLEFMFLLVLAQALSRTSSFFQHQKHARLMTPKSTHNTLVKHIANLRGFFFFFLLIKGLKKKKESYLVMNE